jgi:hypothetical protein
MPSRSKKSRPRKPSDGASAAKSAPPIDAALTELVRRSVRAGVWLVLRLVCAGFLLALVARQSPALAKAGAWLQPLAGLLVTLPFFTALGKNYAWRIALGRAYVAERRWSDAEKTLGVLTGARAALFDAAGEGRYHLAVARGALGRADDASRLFAEVAAQGAAAWREKARAEVGAGAVSSP